ncbi:hypothetical protein D4R42_00020 [bacterium]|nr:MAG: hypothetical protein D4R42_00020 [bacterium]
MKLDKKAWCIIGLIILGIILSFTTVKIIGNVLLATGLVGFILFNTGIGKKMTGQKSEKFEEKPIETEVGESEATKEEDIV